MSESNEKLHKIVKKFTNSQEMFGLTYIFYANNVHMGPPIIPYPLSHRARHPILHPDIKESTSREHMKLHIKISKHCLETIEDTRNCACRNQNKIWVGYWAQENEYSNITPLPKCDIEKWDFMYQYQSIVYSLCSTHAIIETDRTLSRHHIKNMKLYL